ncbi:PREDICTED: uncharacterized protein LOC108368254 [Rhagoletis zephyria]|uniref:uncharacterized protein LOC108368254 n=1 Tax=Rhagoletis zephyria TaxID=28612 RepID=UPI0008117041|nr:PREDICTED: uncharacterized protein LOC108368254 [Rhagoletis zephyria]XP_017478564.1 PREDICTED: uncharacterized protein LOC108368254 [Rhagoletis zephyria]
MDPPQRKRGRRAEICADEYVESVLKFKDRLIEGHKIVPASNSVWQDIANLFNNKVKSASIHALTVSNRYGLLDKLLGRKIFETVSNDESTNEICDDSNRDLDTTLPKKLFFTLTLGKTEFKELLSETSYYITSNGKKRKLRKYTILQQEKWSEILAKKMYDECRLQHVFNFKTHYIYRDATGGSCKDRVIAIEPAQISGPLQLDKIPKCLRAGEETLKLVGCVGFRV